MNRQQEDKPISQVATKAAGLLTHYGFIDVSGEDAGQFLQAQLSADIAALAAEQTVLTGWHDPKGRVLCCLKAVRKSSGYWLALPAAILADTLSGLGRYVLRSRVRLTDASDRLAAAGLLDAGGARYEVYAPAAQLRERLALHHAEGVRPLADGEWELGDILAGLPEVVPETRGVFTGQMLNLDRIGGISFAKGCYPGQEIIARTHHLGRIKRRMQRYRSTGGPLRPGEGLNDDTGRRAGQVVRSAASSTGSESLIVTAADNPQSLAAADGTSHVPERLPYPLTD